MKYYVAMTQQECCTLIHSHAIPPRDRVDEAIISGIKRQAMQY